MKTRYFLILFALAFIGDLLLKGHGAFSGFTAMAVFAGQYDDSMQSYRKLLDTKIRNVFWNRSFWTQLLGEIGGNKKGVFEAPLTFGMKGKDMPTGQPIEVLKDFQYKGRGNMDIPIYYPLTEQGLAGTLTALGKGERPKIANMSITINQERKVYLAQDSKMSPQLLQNPQQVKKLVRGGAEYLGDWFGRWFGFQPHYAFLEGYSENLVLPKANGGLAFARASHMNIYGPGFGTAGIDKVDFSNTVATYEAAVAAALTGLTSGNVFSTATIESAVFVARHYHRMAPMSYEGTNVYPMIISDAAALQLQQDTKWNDRQKWAGERSLKTNPLFTGRIAGMYGGALIIVDETIPSAHVNNGDANFNILRSTTSDTSGVCYGVDNGSGLPAFMATPIDPGPLKPWVIFGSSAIACGTAGDIAIDEEVYDFKQKKEVAADIIIGFQRCDIVDTDGYFGVKGVGDARYENVSSAIGFTYSPSKAAF